MTQPPSTISEPRYELHHDRLEDTYTIRRVVDIGPFATREEAKQYMLDTSDVCDDCWEGMRQAFPTLDARYKLEGR